MPSELVHATLTPCACLARLNSHARTDCEKVREEAAETVDRVFKTAVAQCPGYLAVDSMVPPGSKSADEEIAQLELALAVSGGNPRMARDRLLACRTVGWSMFALFDVLALLKMSSMPPGSH